jgi:aldehyde dehydrogenase (NAD+)
MTETTEHRMLIDGELVGSSGGEYSNVGPATGKAIGVGTNGTADDCARAVAAARAAFDRTGWSRDHAFRRHCLEQLQAALRRRVAEFRDIQIREVGMTVSVAAMSVDATIENMSFMIGQSDSYPYQRELPAAGPPGMRMRRFVRHEPYGVAGLISPWNAPFLTNIWKLTPALAAGNTCVLKAAPATPWSATALGAVILAETDIPAGVVNIITSEDRAEAGEALTGDPRVDIFHFTGSPGVGQRIMERAARGLRKVALELGGKSANILLEDADFDTAIPFAANMCTVLTGQGCALPTRLLLPESRYDEGVERVTAAFAAMPIGDPALPGTVIGPIINRSQLERINGLVEKGIHEGAKATTGGAFAVLDGEFAGGSWYQPTVLADVEPQNTVAQTEIFGPVLTVLRYRDEDQAVSIANGTPYGLAGYVQSADPERALALAARLHAGSIGLNGTATWFAPDLPFGGYGISGLGREHGTEGFEEYLQTKAITIPDTPVREPARVPGGDR